MKFFLDANGLIDIANETAAAARLQTQLDAAGPRRCALSAITIEELHYGVLSGPAVKHELKPGPFSHIHRMCHGALRKRMVGL